MAPPLHSSVELPEGILLGRTLFSGLEFVQNALGFMGCLRGNLAGLLSSLSQLFTKRPKSLLSL
jgi:hypothetical protein